MVAICDNLRRVARSARRCATGGVLSREARKDPLVDLVVAECREQLGLVA
jgi:hypothetical protein